MSDADKAEFTSLIERNLCPDPWEDGVTKAPLQFDDGTLVTLYDDSHWQIIYPLVASRVIEIWAVSKDWFGAG